METPQPNGCGVSFFRPWGFFFRLRGLFFLLPEFPSLHLPDLSNVCIPNRHIRDIIQRHNTGIKKGPSPVTGRLLLSVLLALRITISRLPILSHDKYREDSSLCMTNIEVDGRCIQEVHKSMLITIVPCHYTRLCCLLLH